MKTLTAVLAAAVLSAAFCGCASEGVRVDANTEAVATHDFNPMDLQILTDKTVSKLMKRGADLFPPDRKARLYVAKVRNLTNEIITMDLITERVATQMDDTGKVRLVTPPKDMADVMRALDTQSSAAYDPTSAARVGKQIGAEFMIIGDLANLESRSGGKKGQYFQFTLTLIKIETGEQTKVQEPIQKLTKSGLFGS